MRREYKRRFLILTITVLCISVLYFFLSQIKVPSFDIKNFFTLSKKSPEYLLDPINISDITRAQEGNYPHVTISPKSPLYPFINFYLYWEVVKKKYDNLFFASKSISELITFGKDISWEKQLDIYHKHIDDAITEYVNINDPRSRMNQFISLYKQVMGHQQKVYQLLYATDFSEQEKDNITRKIDSTFTPIYQKLNYYLPIISYGSITYSLFDPILDREFGIYEGQFIIEDKSTGKLYNIEVGNKSAYLHLPIDGKPVSQNLNWTRAKDINNTPIYIAEIFPTFENNTIYALIKHTFNSQAKIRIQRIFQESDNPAIQQETVFEDVVYYHTNPETLTRVLQKPQVDKINSHYEIQIEILHQPKIEFETTFPNVTLTFYPAIDPAPQLLITKKSLLSNVEPYVSVKKIGQFRYQLIIKNESFFNGRQIKYNLSPGWIVDDKKRVLYFFPGIIVEYILGLLIVLSLFYGFCLFIKKPLDAYLISLARTCLGILKYFLKVVYFVLKKIFDITRFWALLFGFITMIVETFFHTQAYYLLVLITVVFWILGSIGYSLESRFSFTLSFIFFISSAVFLILKPDNNINFNADHVSPFEIIADKLAIWTIVFLMIGFISVIIELTTNRKSRSIKDVVSQIKNDLLHMKQHLKDVIHRYEFIGKTLHTIVIAYRPKSLNPKDVFAAAVKLFITFLVIAVIMFTKIQYDRYQQFLNVQPEIIKFEPKIVYRSIKVILWGRSLGGTGNGELVKLKSQYGEIHKDFWSDSKIIFTVPQIWNDGIIDIWIEKPVLWNGHIFASKSKSIKLKLIPTTSRFLPDDEKYFNQLKTLDKETLKLNGYQ